jgi:hypothetical protein
MWISKGKSLLGLFILLTSSAFAIDYMVVVDNRVNNDLSDCPHVETVFSSLRTIAFSESDNVGIVLAGTTPVLVFPPNGNAFFLESSLAAALGAPGTKSDMAGAIDLALEQLEQYGAGVERRIFILTSGGNAASIPSLPPMPDIYSFLIGDLDPDYKNAIQQLSRHSYELNSLETLQKALAGYLKDSGSFKGYKVNLDDKGGLIDFTHVNFPYALDKIVLFLQYRNTIPTDALNCRIVFNKQEFKLNPQETPMEIGGAFTAALVPLGERGAFVIIRHPSSGKYSVSIANSLSGAGGLFLPVTAVWSGNLRVVLVGIIALVAAALVGFLFYWFLIRPYKPVFGIKVPSIASKVVYVARRKGRGRLGPGSTLKDAAGEIDPTAGKDRYKALENHTIKFDNGRWQISNLPGRFTDILENLKKNNGTIEIKKIIDGQERSIEIRKK